MGKKRRLFYDKEWLPLVWEDERHEAWLERSRKKNGEWKGWWAQWDRDWSEKSFKTERAARKWLAAKGAGNLSPVWWKRDFGRVTAHAFEAANGGYWWSVEGFSKVPGYGWVLGPYYVASLKAAMRAAAIAAKALDKALAITEGAGK